MFGDTYVIQTLLCFVSEGPLMSLGSAVDSVCTPFSYFFFLVKGSEDKRKQQHHFDCRAYFPICI